MKKTLIVAICLLTFVISLILCGCGIRCIIFNHEFNLERVEEATCTQSACKVYKCARCKEEKREDVGMALGHDEEIVKQGYPATCLNTGMTDEIVCRRCERTVQEREIIPIAEHTPFVTKNGYSATCSKTGLTNELSCRVCNAVISEQKTIQMLPHNEKVSQKGYAPTCTQSGRSDTIVCDDCNAVVSESVVIPAMGHADSDSDSVCDRCYYPTGSNVVAVSSVNDLARINENLNGVYLLKNDIALSADWVPIGSEDAPFRGVFYGDGHTLSNLTLKNSSLGGVFGHNNGTICNINLNNITITATNADCSIGGLAGVNNGKIFDCNISGKIGIICQSNCSFSVGYPLYESKTVNYDMKFGGMCAVNNGKVSNCNVSTKLNVQISNTAKYTLTPSPLFFLGGNNKLVVTDKVYCGGIAGQNNGEIDHCLVVGEFSAVVNINASLGKKYGMCKATVESYLGSIVGINLSRLANCSGITLSMATSKNEDYVFVANFFDQGHISLHIANDETNFSGLIGKNTGKVDDVRYCVK